MTPVPANFSFQGQRSRLSVVIWLKVLIVS